MGLDSIYPIYLLGFNNLIEDSDTPKSFYNSFSYFIFNSSFLMTIFLASSFSFLYWFIMNDDSNKSSSFSGLSYLLY
jgi:hypothetical protein